MVSTREEVLSEHQEIVKRLGTFGVPTIVLDDNTVRACSGPSSAPYLRARLRVRCGTTSCGLHVRPISMR